MVRRRGVDGSSLRRAAAIDGDVYELAVAVLALGRIGLKEALERVRRADLHHTTAALV